MDLMNRILIICVIGILFCIPLAPVTNTLDIDFDSTFKTNIITQINGDGNTLYVGGSGPDNYTRIQDAIDNASSGNTVFVYDDSSPYQGNITIDKFINLIGENRDTTIIQDGNWQKVIEIQANKVYISGFTIRNGGRQDTFALIRIHSNATVIARNRLELGKCGVYLRYGHNALITYNSISKCDYGIFNSFSNYTDITNNYIENNDFGIEISHSNHTEIINNTIYDNDNGIFLDESNNNIVQGNTINSTQVHSLFLFSSNHNEIRDNNILSSQWGILVDNALTYGGFNLISYNHISNTEEYAIHIGWSIGNKIIGNQLSHNHIGIYLVSSLSARITQNNFIQNTQHATFEDFILFGLLPLNLWNNNYWGRPHILPKPIAGKLVPIGFLWLKFDLRPRLLPHDWWLNE